MEWAGPARLALGAIVGEGILVVRGRVEMVGLVMVMVGML